MWKIFHKLKSLRKGNVWMLILGLHFVYIIGTEYKVQYFAAANKQSVTIYLLLLRFNCMWIWIPSANVARKTQGNRVCFMTIRKGAQNENRSSFRNVIDSGRFEVLIAMFPKARNSPTFRRLVLPSSSGSSSPFVLD
jgi:hypothetical protein